ncbi:cytochrome b5 [Anaeromyces robustus]|uniref:Cytochrome b5 n=1 Tax=Anaeromyces robustus TaxID=1754192 RepID=A0A1Y1X171_9FUNG|nr:cytochrome b5 [Anaeromyces robustus]|eukprot:ORX79561.1 cytochrome b5 [Anaeromyces robustus]
MEKQNFNNKTNDTEEKKKLKKKYNNKNHSVISTFFKLLLHGVIFYFSASYLITNTFSWGKKFPNWRRYIPRKELTFTEKELAEYDGTDPSKPIYLSCKGNVYDVTKGAHFYGPGAGYHLFAGRDSSRALATGCLTDEKHWTHDLRGLDENQLSIIDSWDKFWKNNNQYFYVGKLIYDPIDPNTEPPEDCEIAKKAKKRLQENKEFGKDPSLSNLIGSFM